MIDAKRQYLHGEIISILGLFMGFYGIFSFFDLWWWLEFG